MYSNDDKANIVESTADDDDDELQDSPRHKDNDGFITTQIDRVARIFKRFIKEPIYKTGFFPFKFIATSCTLGFLPEWQHGWSAFLAAILSGLVLYLNLQSGAMTVVGLALPLFITFLICLLVGSLAISVYQTKDSSANEEITINTFTFQIFTFAVAMPATIAIGKGIISFNTAMCDQYLYCSPWFFKTFSYTLVAAVPFAVARFCDIKKFWPSAEINLRYNNALSKMMESFICSVYALTILYLVALIVFDITLVDAIRFWEQLLKGTMNVILRARLDIEEDILDDYSHF